MLWGVNGTVSKVILASGVSSLRLTEVRCAGALRRACRDPRGPRAAADARAACASCRSSPLFGIVRARVRAVALLPRDPPASRSGSPCSCSTSRRSSSRSGRGSSTTSRCGGGSGSRSRSPSAGSALIVDVGTGGGLSGAGLVFALPRPPTYMLYLLLAEHAVADRGAVALLFWGFGFATLFFSLLAPVVELPGPPRGRRRLAARAPLRPAPAGLAADDLDGLPRDDRPVLPARQRAAATPGDPGRIIAMLEPVVATVVAWVWLGEASRRPSSQARSSCSPRSCSPRPPAERSGSERDL